MKRWLLLENYPAVRSGDFFPPEEVWPELAHLRAEHQRLLAVRSAEWRALQEVENRHEAEDAARGEALKASFLTNGDEPGEDNRETAEYRATDVEDAQLRVEAATDALVTFLTEALAETKARCPEFYELLESRQEDADAKVEEARRLVAEAERVVAEAARMRTWLDRHSGMSVLDPIPYSELGVSAAQPDEALDLTVNVT
jgi:hypothetical protein